MTFSNRQIEGEERDHFNLQLLKMNVNTRYYTLGAFAITSAALIYFNRSYLSQAWEEFVLLTSNDSEIVRLKKIQKAINIIINKSNSILNHIPIENIDVSLRNSYIKQLKELSEDITLVLTELDKIMSNNNIVKKRRKLMVYELQRIGNLVDESLNKLK